MLLNHENWNELSEKFRIVTEGQWRRQSNMRPGRRLESQIFSSSSLENVHRMGAFSIIRAGASIGGATIGRFTAIGAGFVCAAPEHPIDTIGTSSIFVKDYPWAQESEGFYGVPASGRSLVSRNVTIGSDVWIGRDVYIKGGVTIGHGAVIAARSVVTKDVPPYAIIAGTPARHLRDRFSESMVAELLDLNWWNFDPAWMAVVDQSNIEACVEYLQGERHDLAPLLPRVVIFTADGYTESDGD